jgi:hypothetical protein
MMVGHLPYNENRLVKGFDLYDLLKKNPSIFWRAHEDIFNYKGKDEEFKDLFLVMTRADPDKRVTMQEIKESAFMKKETFTLKEVQETIKLAKEKKNQQDD